MINANRFLILLAFLAANFFSLLRAPAQLLEPVPDTASAVPSATAEPVRKVDDIYQLTRSAKSTADFENIVTACQTLLLAEISPKDHKYLVSLIAWAENRSAEKYASNARSMLQLGLTDQGNEQRQLAIHKFDEVIKNHPLTWRAWMGRAILHAEQQEYELALTKFQQVVKLNQRSANARFNCAEIQYHLRQYDESIATYTRLIDLDPTDCLARTGRGHCWLMTENADKAFSDYKTVVDLYPENASALCNAGDALAVLGRWSEAKEHFESGIQSAKSGLAHRQLAQFHLDCPDKEISDPRKAVDLIKTAMEKDGNSSGDLKILAAAYRATGQFQLAEQTMTSGQDE